MRAKPCLGILGFAQMRRAFRDDHFQRRPHMGCAEVPGHGAAVASAEDDMDIERGFALWAFSNVSIWVPVLSPRSSTPPLVRLLGVSLFVGGDAAPYAERQLRPSPGHLLKSLPDLELLALQRPTAALQGVKCIFIRWRHDTIETLTQLRELKLKSAT
jgi:hypothetical protein